MEQPPPTPSPPPSESSDQPSPGKRARLVEDLFTLVCIFSLWPVVLGWEGPVYRAILYVALAGLVFVFVRRMNRFREARREAEGHKGNGR